MLAYELTQMVHGKEEAEKAEGAAKAVFGGGGDLENMPTSTVSAAEIGNGVGIVDLLVSVGFLPSKGEGRRLVQQGGLTVNGEKVTDAAMNVSADMFDGDGLMIKKGKKVFHRIVIK